jgi:hypothetical protein
MARTIGILKMKLFRNDSPTDTEWLILGLLCLAVSMTCFYTENKRDENRNGLHNERIESPTSRSIQGASHSMRLTHFVYHVRERARA